MKKNIYLDHASTTPVHPEVVKAMLPYFGEKYGNPSTLYALGREARTAIEEAREQIANILGASKPTEIIFTSGGTESDNLAIKGICEAYKDKGRHIITSSVEHSAVIHTFEYMEKQGYEVTYLPVDKYGIVDINALKESIRPDTIFVSIMTANNEVGTIQPVKEISNILKEKNIIFHTDAVQAIGSLPVNVQDLGVDALSLSAHKFYGPKGTGALYLKRGIRIVSQNIGGSQERRHRAGTENVPGIIGMAKALEIACGKDFEEKNKRITNLRNRLINGVMDSITKTHLTGDPVKRLPNSASFVFEQVEGESILLNLDLLGIAATSGSACTSDSLEPSYVLKAMGVPIEIAHGSLRLTLGTGTTEEDINYVLEHLPKIIDKLRAMSPLAGK
ncbi:MAG: cysteine desulfurase NifS [Armatimonadota bacterium]